VTSLATTRPEASAVAARHGWFAIVHLPDEVAAHHLYRFRDGTTYPGHYRIPWDVLNAHQPFGFESALQPSEHLFAYAAAAPDLPIPELVENRRRSVAMLRGGAPALNRDEALESPEQLRDALREVRDLRRPLG
jgi:hypothetical protein